MIPLVITIASGITTIVAVIWALHARAGEAWALEGWRRSSTLYEEAAGIIRDVKISAVQQNISLRAELNAIKSKRSRSASIARRAQVEQQRAKQARATEALRNGTVL